MSCELHSHPVLQCAVKLPSTGKPTPITKLAAGLGNESTAARDFLGLKLPLKLVVQTGAPGRGLAEIKGLTPCKARFHRHQWLLERDFIARISPEISRRWEMASAV
jgi:hypothetical protein